MNEISALLRDTRHELCVYYVRIWGGGPCEAGREPLPDIKAVSILILDFLASRTARNEFLLFKPTSLHGGLLELSGLSKTLAYGHKLGFGPSSF